MKPLKIFVIDDEESIRQSLQWYFEDLGHSVITAADPKAFCEVWSNHACSHETPCGDVLIIDNFMPGMTGLEFIQRMLERGCKGVVANMLIMSASFSEADLTQARQLGCHILAKPFSMEMLDSWISGVQPR